MENEEDSPILIRVTGSGNTTITPDEPDDAHYIYVETEEEKEYLEFLKDKDKFSILGLQSKLSGMRLFQEFKEKKEGGYNK